MTYSKLNSVFSQNTGIKVSKALFKVGKLFITISLELLNGQVRCQTCLYRDFAVMRSF